jgi:hypothetical protein
LIGALTLVLAVGLPATGSVSNVFQTARTLGQGNVALNLGMAAMTNVIDEDNDWIFIPQGRLAIGLTDGVDLGVRVFGLDTGNFGSFTVMGDIKASLFAQPEGLALSLGFGGGSNQGWAIGEMSALCWQSVYAEGSIYVGSTLPYLPVYFVYRLFFPLGGGWFTIQHQLVGGLHLMLSPTTRLLIEIFSRHVLLSAGIGLEILF